MEMTRQFPMKLTRESILLILICLVDLTATVLLLRHGSASEGNPLMSYYLRYGIGTFIMMKLTLIILPIFIAEWSRQYRPGFVRLMMRTAIGVYLGSYLILFLTINVGLARPSDAPPAPPPAAPHVIRVK